MHIKHVLYWSELMNFPDMWFAWQGSNMNQICGDFISDIYINFIPGFDADKSTN